MKLPPTNTYLLDFVSHVGGKKAAADFFDVTETAINQWLRGGGLPPLRAIEVQARLGVDKFSAVDLIAQTDA